MKKVTPIVVIILGLYFIWSAISVVISKSNHMGSRINIANDYLQYQLENGEEKVSPQLSKKIKQQTDIIVIEGKLGFALLEITAFKLLLSGVVLIFAGSRLLIKNA